MRAMHKIAWIVAVGLLANEGKIKGQYVTGARAGLVNYIEGDVFADGVRLRGSQAVPPFVKEKQTLRTEDGRAEILLTPDIFLRIGQSARMRMEATALSDVQVTLEQGPALIEVVHLIKGSHVLVHWRDAETEFLQPGLYRFDADQGQLLIYGGEAEARFLDKRGHAVKAKPGTSVALNDNLKLSKFDRKAQDGLHLWAGKRSANRFTENALAGKKGMQWIVLDDPRGLLWNPDYGMRVPSVYALAKIKQVLIEGSNKNPNPRAPGIPPPASQGGSAQGSGK